ncbi:MAG TPA: hypothetical protein VF371_04580 [Candidatus Limnocylindrales bacterium]
MPRRYRPNRCARLPPHQDDAQGDRDADRRLIAGPAAFAGETGVFGAGWHEGEHEQFGIPLPPIAERFDRFESALGVLAALFSDAARRPPGVTLTDPFYPLRGATLEPGTMRPKWRRRFGMP